MGSGPESLKKVTMIGNDMRLDSGVTWARESRRARGRGPAHVASKAFRGAARPDHLTTLTWCEGGAASAAVARRALAS